MKETNKNCYYFVANRRHMISFNVLCCCSVEMYVCRSVITTRRLSVSLSLAHTLMIPLRIGLLARRSPYLHTAACFLYVNIDCVVARWQLRAATTISAGCLCLLFNNQNESKRNERQNGMRKTKRKLVIIRYFAESVVNVCCWCHPRLLPRCINK